MRRGAWPLVVSMRAPIAPSGSATRRIGRGESEASPVRTLAKSWPASRPASSRIVVPELPQSRSAAGRRSPRVPTPSMVNTPRSASVTRTPSARTHASVDRGSAASGNPSTVEVPSPMAANRTARWATLLSGGRRTVPWRTVRGEGSDIGSAEWGSEAVNGSPAHPPPRRARAVRTPRSHAAPVARQSSRPTRRPMPHEASRRP